MNNKRRGGDVYEEPQYRGFSSDTDQGEARATRLIKEEEQRLGEAGLVEHGVAAEPALGTAAASLGESFSSWVAREKARMSVAHSWSVTLLAALAAGPWGILGAFFGESAKGGGLLAVVLFAPMIEEIMKVAIPSFLIEKRPFVFISPWQIFLCCFAGGLAFAALENLIYLKVYIPDHTPGLALYRIRVCTSMHVIASCIASLGLIRLWKLSMSGGPKPEFKAALPWIGVAMVLHGAYNAFAIYLSLSGYVF